MRSAGANLGTWNKRDLFIIINRDLVSGDNDEEELIWVEQSAIFCIRRLVESFTTCLSLPCMYTFVYLLRCLACFNAWWFWFRYFLLVENVGHEKREWIKAEKQSTGQSIIADTDTDTDRVMCEEDREHEGSRTGQSRVESDKSRLRLL